MSREYRPGRASLGPGGLGSVGMRVPAGPSRVGGTTPAQGEGASAAPPSSAKRVRRRESMGPPTSSRSSSATAAAGGTSSAASLSVSTGVRNFESRNVLAARAEEYKNALEDATSKYEELLTSYQGLELELKSERQARRGAAESLLSGETLTSDVAQLREKVSEMETKLEAKEEELVLLKEQLAAATSHDEEDASPPANGSSRAISEAGGGGEVDVDATSTLVQKFEKITKLEEKLRLIGDKQGLIALSFEEASNILSRQAARLKNDNDFETGVTGQAESVSEELSLQREAVEGFREALAKMSVELKDLREFRDHEDRTLKESASEEAVEALRSEVRDLTQSLEAKESAVKESEATSAKREAELRDEVDRLNDSVRALTSRADVSVISARAKDAMLEESASRESELGKEIERLRARAAEAESRVDELRAAHLDKQSSLEKKIAELQEKEKKTGLELEMEQLTSRTAEAESQKGVLFADHQERESLLEKRVTELTERRAALEFEIDRLTARSVEAESQASKLVAAHREEVSSLERRVAELAEIRATLEQDIDRLTAKSSEAEVQAEILAGAQREKESSLAKIEMECLERTAQLESEIESLTRALQKKKDSMTAIETGLRKEEELLKKVTELTEREAQLRTEVGKLTTALESRDSEAKSHADELRLSFSNKENALKNQIESLTKSLQTVRSAPVVSRPHGGGAEGIVTQDASLVRVNGKLPDQWTIAEYLIANSALSDKIDELQLQLTQEKEAKDELMSQIQANKASNVDCGDVSTSSVTTMKLELSELRATAAAEAESADRARASYLQLRKYLLSRFPPTSPLSVPSEARSSTSSPSSLGAAWGR